MLVRSYIKHICLKYLRHYSVRRTEQLVARVQKRCGVTEAEVVEALQELVSQGLLTNPEADCWRYVTLGERFQAMVKHRNGRQS